MIKFIVAMLPDFTIGVNNSLPFECKEDMDYFKEKTNNQAVLMGGNTFRSMGSRPLKGRKCYVLSKSIDIESIENYDNVVLLRNKLDVFNLMYYYKYILKEDLFLIGGGYLYREFINYCDSGYINIIKNTKYISGDNTTKLNLDFRYVDYMKLTKETKDVAYFYVSLKKTSLISLVPNLNRTYFKEPFTFKIDIEQVDKLYLSCLMSFSDWLNIQCLYHYTKNKK